MQPFGWISPPTIIVVEDDPAVLSSLKFAFEIEGFHVQAHTSAEALLDGDAPPERGCLVLDYRLPGMDALALVCRLRERGHQMPAVLITTSNAEVRRRAALAGVEVIDKPLKSDELVAKVFSLLGACQP